MSITRTVQLASRERHINSRGVGCDTYAMIGLPGSSRLRWADQVTGAEIVSDDYPRSRGVRAAERRGKQVVRVPLPAGAVIVYIEKHTDRRTTRHAVKVSGADDLNAGAGDDICSSELPSVSVFSRKTDGGWVTVVDGVEYV